MRVRAFAKINLSLRVLGTRADGYHELRTIFQSIALHDTLTIRAIARAVPPDLRRSGAVPPTTRTWSGARRRALWRAAGRRGAPRGVAIDLREAHSDAGRARRRQQRRGGGAARARAAVARRRREGARGGRGARRRRAVLSRRRHGARPRARRPAVSARSIAPPCVGRARAARLRRQHEGRVRVVRRTREREALSRAAVARLKGSRSSLTGQRSRGAGRRAAPRDRPYHFGTSAAGRRPRRRCRAAARRYSACFPRRPAAVRAAARLRLGLPPDAGHPDPQPHELPDTCRHLSPSDKLTVCAAWFRPLLRSASPSTRRRRAGTFIGASPSGKARDFGSRIRRFESFRPSQLAGGCAGSMGDPFMATGFGELKVFSGSAHPELTREIAAFLGVPARAGAAAPVSGLGGLVPDRREHPRHRRLHRAADLQSGRSST